MTGVASKRKVKVNRSHFIDLKILHTMKAMFLFLIFSVFFGVSSMHAQENVVFPITGTFLVSSTSVNPSEFDKVVVEKTSYSIYKGTTLLRTYKIVSKNSEGFLVEQFFAGNEKKDKPRFTVSLDKVDKNNYYITVFRGNRVEKIKLTKS